MLFQIDDGVPGFLQSDAATDQDFDALQYLAMGVAEGSHRVVGQRRTLINLARLQRLGLRDRKTFERAAARVAEEGKLANKLLVTGRVVVSAEAGPTSEMIGKRRVITFPLRWFESSARIQPVVLLGENLSDVGVLLKIAEAGVILASIGYLPIKARPTGGGGSTTGHVLREIAMSGQTCVCVVDSDKSFPGADAGSTALTTAPFKDSASYPLVDVLETAGRDLENALPDSFYLRIYGRHQNHGPMAKFIVQLTTRGEREIRDHIDIQKGFALRDVFSLPSESAEFVFWNSKLNALLASSEVSETTLPCLTLRSCQRPTADRCECLIIQGNRANVLDDFLAAHQETDPYTLIKELDNSVRAEWLRIGSRVGSWCCGDSRLRI